MRTVRVLAGVVVVLAVGVAAGVLLYPRIADETDLLPPVSDDAAEAPRAGAGGSGMAKPRPPVPAVAERDRFGAWKRVCLSAPAAAGEPRCRINAQIWIAPKSGDAASGPATASGTAAATGETAAPAQTDAAPGSDGGAAADADDAKKPRQLLLAAIVHLVGEKNVPVMTLRLPRAAGGEKVSFRVDENPAFVTPAAQCGQGECQATMSIPDRLLEQLQAGKKLNVEFTIVEGRRATVGVPLEGFRDALAALRGAA